MAAPILLHTWAVINGEQAIRDTLMRWGLPVGLAWTAVIFEGIAPIMVILGVYARVGACMMTFWMVMAFALAHIDTGHIFELAPNGVGWRVEGPFFFLALSFAVALQGAGRYGLTIGGNGTDRTLLVFALHSWRRRLLSRGRVQRPARQSRPNARRAARKRSLLLRSSTRRPSARAAGRRLSFWTCSHREPIASASLRAARRPHV